MEPIQALYQTVEKRIAQLDFGGLWPDFHPFAFALRSGDQVCLHDRLLRADDSFRGNTAVPYGGSYLALWNLDYEAALPAPERLAADLVHEMFHAFQLEQGEARFPDDLEALDYPMDAGNFSRKLAENRLLARAVRERSRARELLESFCALREDRQRSIGPWITREYLPETVEGMAEYVGLKALDQLAPEQYRRQLGAYLSRLETAGPLQLDVRRISYFTGPALLLAAEAAGLSVFHSLAGENRPLYQLIRPQLTPAEVPPAPLEPLLEAELARRALERRDTLSRFFREAKPPVSGDFLIQGYDPMNLFKQGNLLYGSHFWRLLDRERREEISLTGPAVLLCAGGYRVSRYWTK